MARTGMERKRRPIR